MLTLAGMLLVWKTMGQVSLKEDSMHTVSVTDQILPGDQTSCLRKASKEILDSLQHNCTLTSLIFIFL